MTVFDAFLCHSTKADGSLVAQLRHELQMRSRRFFGLRRLHLFQDRFDLGGTPTLWPTLEQRLKSSRKLVVILTPQSEESPGMEQEISWWLQNRPIKDLCLVALSGDIWWDDDKNQFGPGNAIPKILQRHYPCQPFYFDLRGYRGQHDRSGDMVGDTFWALLANLLGTTADDVRRKDRSRRRTEIGSALVVSIALVTIGAVAVNAVLDARVSAVGRADAERRIEADGLAGQALGLRDRDPRAAAQTVQQALDFEETNLAMQALYQTTQRWPFLSGIWAIEKPAQAITTDVETGHSIFCAGETVWTLEHSLVGSAPQKHVLTIPQTPAGYQAICRFETIPNQNGRFLIVEFVMSDDAAPNVALPGPTVFAILGNQISSIHNGEPEDSASDVCADAKANGLSFGRDGVIWLCRDEAALRLSTDEQSIVLGNHIVEDAAGALRAFLEVPPAPRQSGRGNPTTPNTQSAEAVIFNPSTSERQRFPVQIDRGDRLTALANGGRQIAFRDFGGRAATTNLDPNRAGTAFALPADQRDVDRILFPPGLDRHWTVRSTLYSDREVERSFVHVDSRNGDFSFERFGDFRETPSAVHAPSANSFLVATRSGRIEHYAFENEDRSVRKLRAPGYIRFHHCEPLPAPDGTMWSLFATPSGGLYLIDSDNPEQRMSIALQLSHGAMFRNDDPSRLEDALPTSTEPWIIERLRPRWAAMQHFKVGLVSFKASDDGNVHVALANQRAIGTVPGIVISVDGTFIEVDPPEDAAVTRYPHAGLTLSPKGDRLAVPTSTGLLIYRVDRTTKSVSMERLLPHGNAAVFSPDSSRIAIARNLEVELWDLDCPECSEPKRRLQGHNNGIQVMAFDRIEPLFYSAGFGGRLVLHDLETGLRLDADMPIHADAIGSLCALPNGGAITQDQSSMMIQWNFERDQINNDIRVLSGAVE